MNTATIRERLHDYIRVADEKKIKAIYTMLEDTINEEVKWWKDNGIVNEFQERYDAWDKGKEKGYTMGDIDRDIARLKKKRSPK
ncbi:MAG: hypothetical protein ACTHK8_15085 [Ginsengibacter sp.]|jgi:hypothetical protein